MGRPWRLLPLSAGDAARNMATDEAIFRAYTEGRVPPTLRFYTWDPPAVSCGRFQDVAREVNLTALARHGYQVVRRPTGGRAVLHQGDLTYAVIAGEADGLPPGTIPAYLQLSRGILAGLAKLGLAARLYTPAGGTAPRGSPACFASPSWYELTISGRKVAGSAQKREGPNLLQHGSIAIDFSPTDLADVLLVSKSGRDLASRLARVAAGLAEFRPGLTPPELVGALAIGFSDALQVEIVDGRLSAVEEDLTEDLMRKYSGEDWLHEGREP